MVAAATGRRLASPTPSSTLDESFVSSPSESPSALAHHPNTPSVFPSSYQSLSPVPYRYNYTIGAPQFVLFSLILSVAFCGIVCLPGILAKYLRRQRERQYDEEFSRRELQYRRGLRTLRTHDRDNGLVGGRNKTERAEFINKNLSIVTFPSVKQKETPQQQHEPESLKVKDTDKNNADQPATTATTAETSAGTVGDVPSNGVAFAESDRGLDQANVCAICLLAFNLGDKVSFSNNPKCSHGFHTSCISAWLQRQEECPCCRFTFLQEIQ